LKEQLETKIKELKESKEGNEAEVLKEKLDSLSQTLSEIGQNLYQQSGKSEDKPREEEKNKSLLVLKMRIFKKSDILKEINKIFAACLTIPIFIVFIS